MAYGHINGPVKVIWTSPGQLVYPYGNYLQDGLCPDLWPEHVSITIQSMRPGLYIRALADPSRANLV